MSDGQPPRPIARPGGYWSADRQDSDRVAQPSETRAVTGDVIRFMWDEGVDGSPLWDLRGPLPDDPTWMHQTLGLSERLTADLRQWGRDVYEMNVVAKLSADEREHQARLLDAEAVALTVRLEDELPTELTVRRYPLLGPRTS